MTYRRYLPIVSAVMISGFVMLTSCEKKQVVVSDLPIKELPSLSGRNVETMYTDSGLVTLIVRTPVFQQFTKKEDPHTLFPEGLTVLFYDRKTSPQASITAHYARYSDKDQQWELRDSVVAVNTEGDILETELLYWSEPRERVWSDRFVRFTLRDKIIMGTGFESDSRLTNGIIKNVSGTIYINDEQKRDTGN
jgi:LPS export ABC transporter protein LptC